jgi:hypothetical protein
VLTVGMGTFAVPAVVGPLALGVAGSRRRAVRGPALGLVFGAVAAIVAMLVAALVRNVLELSVGSEGTMAQVILLAVTSAGAGLDWRRPAGLRAATVFTACPLLVVLLASDLAVGYGAAALVWFLALVATLWSVERDRIDALAAPVPVGTNPAEPTHGADLLRVSLTALTLGLAGTLVAVMLVAEPERHDADSYPRWSQGAYEDPDWYQYEESGGALAVPPAGPPDAEGSPAGRGNPGADERGTTDDGGIAGGGRADGSGADPFVGADPGTGAGSEAGSYGSGDGSGIGDDGRSPDGSTPDRRLLILLMAFLAVLGAAAMIRLLLLPTPAARIPLGPPWAEELWRRLEREGARRGRHRGSSESIRAYASALAESVLPDPRLHELGQQLSLVFFGGGTPPAVPPPWASVLDEACAAHPRSLRRPPAPLTTARSASP